MQLGRQVCKDTFYNHMPGVCRCYFIEAFGLNKVLIMDYAWQMVSQKDGVPHAGNRSQDFFAWKQRKTKEN